MEYGLNDAGFYTVTCTTSGSPPTSITWTRNGAILKMEDTKYTSTQALVNRNETVYENTLTIEGSLEDAVGDYSCTVENYVGVSETANRTIKGMQCVLNSYKLV